MDMEQTELLRATAIKRLEAAGHKCVPISGRGQRYHLDDGSTLSLATQRYRTLICTTDGTGADARLKFEETDYVLFATKSERSPTSTDVYLIPSAVVGHFAREDHYWWLQECSTKGHNTTWQQVLDEDRKRLCHGYATVYRQYLLPEADAAPPSQ